MVSARRRPLPWPLSYAVCHVWLFVTLHGVLFVGGEVVGVSFGWLDFELSLARLAHAAVWGALNGLVGAAIARRWGRPRWLSVGNNADPT